MGCPKLAKTVFVLRNIYCIFSAEIIVIDFKGGKSMSNMGFCAVVMFLQEAKLTDDIPGSPGAAVTLPRNYDWYILPFLFNIVSNLRQF